jgi:hypothetical protein
VQIAREEVLRARSLLAERPRRDRHIRSEIDVFGGYYRKFDVPEAMEDRVFSDGRARRGCGREEDAAFVSFKAEAIISGVETIEPFECTDPSAGSAIEGKMAGNSPAEKEIEGDYGPNGTEKMYIGGDRCDISKCGGFF